MLEMLTNIWSLELAHLTAGVVVPGGDAHPGDEAEDQHDEAEDDEAGGGVAGGPGLSVQQGAHGGHTEVLVTPLQQEVLEVRCSNVIQLIVKDYQDSWKLGSIMIKTFHWQ